jgi:pimeloyl-ACP methyl ester carboxylesterase
VAEALPHLQVRLCAIYGEHDALYSYRMPEVKALMEQLAPRWEGWHTVANSGHWVQYEAAEALNPLLLQVLA